MKLIYIWVDRYNNVDMRQGFQIANDFIVEYLEDGNKFVIKNNQENICRNFYGKNISSVTALIGENGAGKTTISKLIMKLLPGAIEEREVLSKVDFNSITLDSIDHMEFVGWVLYYHFSDEEETMGDFYAYAIGVSERYAVEFENKSILWGDYSYKLQNTGVFISNVFNSGEHLLEFSIQDENFGEESSQNEYYIQQTYTPTFLLKHEPEKQRKGYGYMNYFGDMRMAPCLSEYATLQKNDVIQCYSICQERLFLESFENIPDELKKELHIYDSYAFEIVDCSSNFEKYLKRSGKEYQISNELSDEQKFVAEMMKLYKKTYNTASIQGNLIKGIFLNLLFELVLIFREDFILSLSEELDDKKLFFEKFHVRYNDKEFLKKILHTIKKYGKQTVPRVGEIKRVILLFLIKIKSLKSDCKSRGSFYASENKTMQKETNDCYFLDFYMDELKREQSFITDNVCVKFHGVSSGEIALVNMFSYIVEAMKDHKKKGKDVILVIDEIDAYMHPRWQQMVVKYILQFLEKWKDYNIQLIITSHSPIILSDICSDNVIKLRMDAKEGKHIIVQNGNEKTFAAEITELYHDSFFLNEGNIGEFAKKKINTALKNLTMDGEKSTGCDFMSQRELDYLIDNIGFEPAQRKMRKMYDDFFTKKEERRKSIMEQIKSLPEDEKVRLMEELREEESTND